MFLLFGPCIYQSLLNDKRHVVRQLKYLAPVVQTMDSAIHLINHYPLDNSIGFACVYSVDSDIYGG